MVKAEFGIIEDITETEEYLYNPEKYHCVPIDDEVYIEDWWDKLALLKTYFHSAFNSGLQRYKGIQFDIKPHASCEKA